jgi:WD40 repeat protein
MVTGGFDGKLCLWGVPGFDLNRIIQHGTEGKPTKDEMVVAIAVDEDFVGVGFMSGTIGIYEPSFTQPMIFFQAHSEFLLNLVISRAGMIATASHDKTAKLWVIRGIASCKQTLQGHADYVLAIAFPPRDRVVFTGSKDETIKCWNQKTGEILFTINGHKNTLFQIDHHPTERTIVRRRRARVRLGVRPAITCVLHNSSLHIGIAWFMDHFESINQITAKLLIWDFDRDDRLNPVTCRTRRRRTIPSHLRASVFCHQMSSPIEKK